MKRKKNGLGSSVFIFLILLSIVQLIPYVIAPEIDNTYTKISAKEKLIMRISKTRPSRKLDPNKFSIIIPTYHKRIKMLGNILNTFNYSDMPSLEEVFIYWCDRNNSIDAPDISAYNLTTKINISIIDTVTRRITDRFMIPKDLKTETILSMDDDMMGLPLKIEKSFRFLKENNATDRIVGVTPRDFKNGTYLACFSKNYTMVLTNFAFLNVKMLELFNSNNYTSLVDMVAEMNDGEDILMNYICASVFKLHPVCLVFNVKHLSEEGLSTNTTHQSHRDFCGEKFNEFFGNDTLVYAKKRYSLSYRKGF